MEIRVFNSHLKIGDQVGNLEKIYSCLKMKRGHKEEIPNANEVTSSTPRIANTLTQIIL